MLDPTAADNGGDPPLTGKPVDLRAQCDEEGAARRSKRARCLPQGGVSDVGNTCPVWCHDDTSLPARVQQAHRCGRVIWESPSHTLSGTAHCGPCRRAGVDQCFIAQANSACTRCTSLRNPCGQCMAEPLTTTALNSGRSGVVVLHAHAYGGKRGGGTL